MRHRCLALLVMWVPMGAGAQSVLTIGAQGCDYGDLDAAIAAASSSATTTLRLANDRSYAQVQLRNVGKSLVVTGGFADCAAAESGVVGDARTVISGEAAFTPSAGVALVNLDLRLGGPLTLQGPLVLTLRRIALGDMNGTGVDVECRAASLRLEDSRMPLRSLLGSCLLFTTGEVR